MAFAHTSVNNMSRQYLSNERRYNYTTPKSYLEQISLYAKLLGKKYVELQAKVARLENGLEKLKSTAAQVYSDTKNQFFEFNLPIIAFVGGRPESKAGSPRSGFEAKE
jgi:P-loop containing dynein motor region D4